MVASEQTEGRDPHDERTHLPEHAKLYEIAEAEIFIDQLIEEATDPETGVINITDELLASKINVGEMSEKKIEGYCKAMQNYKVREERIQETIAEHEASILALSEVKVYRDEIKRLRGRLTTMVNDQNGLKRMLLWYLQDTGKQRVDTGTFKVWRQANQVKTLVPASAELKSWPMEYLRPSPDRAALAKAFRDETVTILICKNCGEDKTLVEIDPSDSVEPLGTEADWFYNKDANQFAHICSRNMSPIPDFGFPEFDKDDPDHVFESNEYCTWGLCEVASKPKNHPIIPLGVEFEESEHVRIK